jgi:dihydropteroate synthase
MTPVTTIDPAGRPSGARILDCGGRRLDLTWPQIMGVLNVTPDSFSDGGDFFSVDAAVAHATRMVAEGAAIIDVGGESTRPGAAAVTAEEELARVIPVIAALHAALPDTVISIDTGKPAVMRAAVAAGAGLINDVYALRLDGALGRRARSACRSVSCTCRASRAPCSRPRSTTTWCARSWNFSPPASMPARAPASRARIC